MSPDKTATVAIMANAYRIAWLDYNGLRPGDKDPNAAFVADALKLYDEAQRQVRASGPTSTEKKCTCAGNDFEGHFAYCSAVQR